MTLDVVGAAKVSRGTIRMKIPSFVLSLLLLFGCLSSTGWGQQVKQAKFGKGASVEVPTDWRILEAPNNVVFLAESPDQMATVTVVEEARSQYEVENLLAFHALTVDFYTKKVWPDLDSEPAKEGLINNLPAVFSKVSPTLALGDGRKLPTRGYITVFESPNHYYTVTIVSAASVFGVREQQLLDILRSFKVR